MRKINKNFFKHILQSIGILAMALVPVYLVSSKAKEIVDSGAESAHNRTQRMICWFKGLFQETVHEDDQEGKAAISKD